VSSDRRVQLATALAAAMFRESAPPAIGILTTKSAPWAARQQSPPPLPKIIESRSGWSVARSPGWWPLCPGRRPRQWTHCRAAPARRPARCRCAPRAAEVLR